jgi:N-acetylglutamate synthase-like GNAT family acetyltransferase
MTPLSLPRAVIRHSTQADIDAMMSAPLPCRVRSLTIEVDGRVLGIGGIAYLPNGEVGVFSELTDEVRQDYPVTLHKAGRRLMAMIRDLGLKKLVATTDPEAKTPQRWLERLGFEATGETLGGRMVFRCSMS